MTNFNRVIDYQKYLMKQRIIPTFREYVVELYYIENEDFNVSIIYKLFHLLNCKDDFNISMSKLYEFDLIHYSDTIEDIKKYFNVYNFIENIDYMMKDNIYYLSQEAFKKCLIYTEHTTRYVYYFIFVDRCFESYKKFIQ